MLRIDKNSLQSTMPQANKGARPKVGVVVGSGGIKALAAFSIVEFLAQANISIDLLVGCSGGALVSAVLASGRTPAAGRELLLDVLFNGKLFTKADLRAVSGLAGAWWGRFDQTSGLLKPQRLKNFLHQTFGESRLEDLRPKTVVQTTNVETGEGLILSRGLTWEAVYASGAFFPMLPPIHIEGRWLGDGVYSAPVPVAEAVRRRMDVIITLDFHERLTSNPRGFGNCFRRHIDNTMRSLIYTQMHQAIEAHHHEIIPICIEFDHSINLRDAHEAPGILAAGARAVAEHKEPILAAVRNFPAAPLPEYPRPAGGSLDCCPICLAHQDLDFELSRRLS
jgi:NTE family protein